MPLGAGAISGMESCGFWCRGWAFGRRGKRGSENWDLAKPPAARERGPYGWASVPRPNHIASHHFSHRSVVSAAESTKLYSSWAEMASISPESPEDNSEPIFGVAEQCEDLFQRGRHLVEASGAGDLRRFEERQQRFTAWTRYLGVFAKPTVCLDYRLKRHPDLQDITLRLLGILNMNLLRCKNWWMIVN